MKNKIPKNLIAEILVITVALAIMLTILIPTISKCIDNYSINKCKSNMQLLTDALSERLNDASQKDKWQQLLSSKKSQQTLTELLKYIDNTDIKKLDISNYYLKTEQDRIYLLCSEHEDIEDYSVLIPDTIELPNDNPPSLSLADRLQVTGIRTYMQNESINPDNPSQMQFTSNDDLKRIFPDISVKIIYPGGKEQSLNPDEYTITTSGFDMSVPGTKNITIAYKQDTAFNSTKYASLSFEVLEQTQCPPLIIDFDDKGKYELAAWDWSDYVAEASQTQGGSKNFDASIVYYEGTYYYYPDGFNIDSRRDNTNPDTSAADISNPTIAAYKIPFKTNVIISSKEDEEAMKKVENGALMLEEEQVYIWQTEPSKELQTGWIRVFCEMKKI